MGLRLRVLNKGKMNIIQNRVNIFSTYSSKEKENFRSSSRKALVLKRETK